MKRKLPAIAAGNKAKKAKPEVPEYHLTPSVKDEKSGEIVWPAPDDQLERARQIIIACAKANQTTLIVPDKDADGLTSGVILHRTLVRLGLPESKIIVHLLHKGSTIHSPSESALMQAHSPAYIFILDQGSRASPPIIPTPTTSLIIDHHFATYPSDFPAGASVVSACHSPPVATTSLLTYLICTALHPAVSAQCAWLCCIGTQGDLGNSLKWKPPFPDMSAVLKTHTKKAIADAVSRVNAPRRTARYDVQSAWDALLGSDSPADVLKDTRLREAREEINAEVDRCTHTAPKFSIDGKVAVLRIESEAQVHPLIATRWANHLSSPNLDFVMVANSGYLPDRVNFSCRVARCARARDGDVDIIASLKAIAAAHSSGTLKERLGEDFARGHVQASGGIVEVKEFEELMEVMRVGEKKDKEAGAVRKGKGVGVGAAAQKNTLSNYFGTKKD